ncbi:hypothetical protein ACXYUI_30170, partial [Klebsiella pneumoniae]
PPGYHEDLNSISLETSELAKPAPLIFETDEFSDFTQQMVAMHWRPGDVIYLYIMLPKGVKNPPVILYLYTYTTDNDIFHREEFAR